MDEPVSQRRLSFTGGAGWTALVVLGLTLVLSTTIGLRESAGDDIVNITACYALVYFALVFVLVRIYRPEARLRDALGVRLTNPLHVLLAAALGAGIYPLCARLDERFTAAFPIDDETAAAVERLYEPSTARAKIAVFVGAAVLIPICEELFYRGVLFGALVRGHRDQERRIPLVTFACAGYFAFAQGDFRGMASAFALGVALSWLRAKSGSTLLAIVAHVSHLAVPLGPLLHGGTLRPDASFGTRWMIGSIATSVVAAGALSFAFSRSKAVANARALDRGEPAPDDDDDPE
jgi:membrane protease YdiL (CAAX protease family)